MAYVDPSSSSVPLLSWSSDGWYCAALCYPVGLPVPSREKWPAKRADDTCRRCGAERWRLDTAFAMPDDWTDTSRTQ